MPDEHTNARRDALARKLTRLKVIARSLREETKDNDKAIELVNAEMRELEPTKPGGRRVTVRG